MYKMLLFILLMVIYRGQSIAQSGDDEPYLVATEHYPPYEMEHPADGLKGFDYEVLLEIFSLLNKPVKVEFLPWKRVLLYAQKGRVLGILTCARTEDRSKFMIFSDPLSEFVSGYYTLKNHAGIKPQRLTDVMGAKVGSVEGYESFKALTNVGIQPIASKNTTNALDMLHSGRFQYLYLGKQSTDFIIKQKGLTQHFDFHPISKQNFYFCFSKNYKKLDGMVEAFNRALKTLKSSGRYQAIHRRYR